MTIYDLKSRFQGLLRPIARRLYRAGVTANQVTLSACLVSVAIGCFVVDARRVWFAILPPWMFIRMALNALDGMLARELGQKSALGAYLNELTDVVSDAVLYLPFAFVPPFDWRSVGTVIFAAALGEMAGVVAVMTGASRRDHRPLGKSDPAFGFYLLAVCCPTTRIPTSPAARVILAVALPAAARLLP